MKKVSVLIAAGSGMGADAAKTLAKDGFKIAIMSSSGKGERLAKKLNGIGFTGSNLETKNFKKFIDIVIKKWGRIDVLVNSAGHGPKGKILAINDEEWVKGLETYFLNVVRAARIVTPIMKKQKYGSIINISTYAIFEPEKSFPTSGVMRAGLSSFTKIYSDEYAKYNIRMNNILPGFINSLKTRKNFIKRVPLKRAGKVEEISAVVKLLASKEGSYITGQNIKVDGGITRSV
jgi:NAD(P)-dependent dehydrogenase (short-subunit alcohol dehydrogenase family)